MEDQLEHSEEEIKRLQRCINDLVSVLALPAIWTGGEPSQIVSTLLDALLGMLSLDLVYARLNAPTDEAPIEVVRLAQYQKLPDRPQEIGELLNCCLGWDPRKWPPAIRTSVGDGDISLVPLRLGLQGEVGLIVAGSERADFPQQTERLLLNVAANQASIGLQEARLLTEQKRVADELDRRVAQRTRELGAANEELQLQVGLLQHLPAAAWTIRPDGTPDFVNRNWLEYSGQELDYVRSSAEAWMTALHPEDQERAWSCFWDGIRSGRGFTMEVRCRRAHDGAYRWHLNRAVPLCDAEGNILRFVGTATDIEDLKQSEDNLRRTEEKTRLIIDTALDAVITMDAQGTITSWNKQAEVVFGWSDREAIGQNMSDLIMPEQHRMDCESRLRHFLDNPILRRRIEFTAVRRGGAEFPVEWQVSPMRVGEDWAFSAFIRDITDSKLAEEQLRESELHLRNTQAELAHLTRAMTIGALTASIAHEINQPLAGIITNASTCLRMLGSEPPNVEGARETARRTIRDGNRASEVITRLRALFSNKASTTECIDLNEATREVVALSSSELQKSRVILRLELADDLPPVKADRVQLQQVIMNLLRNASDAMSGVDDRPRRLVIKTRPDEPDRVCLTVQDTGLAFDPQAMERLFEPFYTTKNDGMGMGLSVSRSIIEGHQGRLWATLNDGPGATFSFSIPRGRASATGADSNHDVRTPGVTDAA